MTLSLSALLVVVVVVVGIVTEAAPQIEKRPQDDLMLRRPHEEQENPTQVSALDVLWPFPAFRFPDFPEIDLENTEDKKDKKKKPVKSVKGASSEESEKDGDSDEDQEGIEVFLENVPVPDTMWEVIPLIPEVPEADNLPNNYDNSTYEVHIINGSRVEVNTTTIKDSSNGVTTFFHAEVINILPENPKPDDDTTEVPQGGESEEATVEADQGNKAHTEDPSLVVPAEVETLLEEVNTDGRTTTRGRTTKEDNNNSNSNSRPVRKANTTTTTTTTFTTRKTKTKASYVKGKGKTKTTGKDSGAIPGRPRDLSGDTLVNILPGGREGGKEEEPDAEYISSEEVK